MVYLIIISLLLHLISFMAIIVLYQKIEKQKPLDKEQTIKEMEDLLISYTAEMKDNNERLARRLSGLADKRAVPGPDHSLTPTQSGTGTSSQEGQQDQMKEKHGSSRSVRQELPENYSSEGTKDAYDSYKPPLPEDDPNNQPFETSDTSKVLSLSKQGYSETEIARRLNMGAGEVALLLKFYK